MMSHPFDPPPSNKPPMRFIELLGSWPRPMDEDIIIAMLNDCLAHNNLDPMQVMYKDKECRTQAIPSKLHPILIDFIKNHPHLLSLRVTDTQDSIGHYLVNSISGADAEKLLKLDPNFFKHTNADGKNPTHVSFGIEASLWFSKNISHIHIYVDAVKEPVHGIPRFYTALTHNEEVIIRELIDHGIINATNLNEDFFQFLGISIIQKIQTTKHLRTGNPLLTKDDQRLAVNVLGSIGDIYAFMEKHLYHYYRITNYCREHQLEHGKMTQQEIEVMQETMRHGTTQFSEDTAVHQVIKAITENLQNHLLRTYPFIPLLKKDKAVETIEPCIIQMPPEVRGKFMQKIADMIQAYGNRPEGTDTKAIFEALHQKNPELPNINVILEQRQTATQNLR